MSGLSTYNPIWDQSRASTGDGRTFEDEAIIIATDFEGGNGSNIKKVGADHFSIDLEPEPGENPYGYSGIAYYVCFGVRNKLNRERTVRVRLNGICMGREDFSAQRHMVIRKGPTWHQLQADRIHRAYEQDAPVPDVLELEVTVPGSFAEDNTLFLSNFHWWPYSEVEEYMTNLAHVNLRQIGTSFLNKPLYAVEMGATSPGAPCIVHAATSQASEMGHLACRGMIDFVLSEDPDATWIRDRYHICFLPVTNPDGNIMGHGLVDAQGRFQYFEGHFAAEGDSRASPETIAVWRYLREKRPWLFWEWHSNNWARRRGNMLLRYRPELLADDTMRNAWNNLDQELLDIPDTYHESWTSFSEGPYRNSMGFQAVTKLGSIAHMIKQHDRYPLHQTQTHAIECLRAAAHTLWREEKL